MVKSLFCSNARRTVYSLLHALVVCFTKDYFETYAGAVLEDSRAVSYSWLWQNGTSKQVSNWITEKQNKQRPGCWHLVYLPNPHFIKAVETALWSSQALHDFYAKCTSFRTWLEFIFHNKLEFKSIYKYNNEVNWVTSASLFCSSLLTTTQIL